MIDALIAIAGFMAILAITYIIGYAHGSEDEQDDLVKSGHAEYYLDENNEKQWRMKK